MTFIANLSISKRLIGAFVLILSLMLGIATVSWYQLQVVGGLLENASGNLLPSVKAVGQLKESLSEARRNELRVLLESSMSERANVLDKIEASLKLHEKESAEYVKLYTNDDEKRVHEKALAAYRVYAEQLRKFRTLVTESRGGVLPESLSQTALVDSFAKFSAARDALDELAVFNMKLSEQEKAAGSKAIERTSFLLGLSVAIAAILAIGMGWWLTRSIVGPINAAVDAADQIAKGDLKTSFSSTSRDEVGKLMQALQAMVGSLRAVIADVKAASDQIATASSEIAQGNADLSARTESQASSLQQTAASVEQLTGTVRQNADSAKQANQLAAAASMDANRGGDVVNQVVGTMSEIQTSSQKIADIIGVIDGIAFQTNILALNAAVEAARAGEQGRGFAVVAGEVRTLAQRSAQAAKEIKSLISSSVEKVESGTKLVDEAGKSMTEIVQSVQRVTDIIAEISAATTEQASGIQQVNLAVSQLDQMTQQNAALVEQSAAAAASLRDQTTRLNQSVSVFQVDHSVRAASASTTPQVSSAPQVAKWVAPTAPVKAALAPASKPSGIVKPAFASSASSKSDGSMSKSTSSSAKPSVSAKVPFTPTPVASGPPVLAGPVAAPKPAAKLASLGTSKAADDHWEEF
jgi:methyl-accepting chemotaxis protein-1 (serine sensor receptor)